MLRETESSRNKISRHGSIELLVLLSVFFFTTSFAGALPQGNNRPLRVIDRNGTFVGFTITENLVAREIDGTWVSFYVHTGQGLFDSNAIYVYFTTADCSGTRYIPHYSMFAEGTRVGAQLYYPADQQTLNPQSLRLEYGSGESGPCHHGSDLGGVYGVVTTIDVRNFHFELPFRAVQ